jgi:tetratricopeptide (TPR) repeat protein
MRCLGFAFLLMTIPTPVLLAAVPGDDFDTAEQLYLQGDVAQAEALYSGVKPDHPKYAQARLRLGSIYYATERPAQAEKSFEECLKFHQSAEAYCLLAGAQFNLEKFTQADDSAKKALSLDPHYAKAYTMQGMIYTAIGDWADALASYRESLRLSPDHADTWFMMGRGYFLRNDFPKAKEAFETALRLSPQQVRTYENLALTLDLIDQPSAAEKVYRDGIRMNQLRKYPDGRIHLAYGTFLAKLNRATESRAQFREAVRVAPQDGEAHYELARLLFRMKQWEEAAQEGETALRAGGFDLKLHYLLSRIYTAMGNSEAAAKHAQEAARLADKQP